MEPERPELGKLVTLSRQPRLQKPSARASNSASLDAITNLNVAATSLVATVVEPALSVGDSSKPLGELVSEIWSLKTFLERNQDTWKDCLSAEDELPESILETIAKAQKSNEDLNRLTIPLKRGNPGQVTKWLRNERTCNRLVDQLRNHKELLFSLQQGLSE